MWLISAPAGWLGPYMLAVHDFGLKRFRLISRRDKMETVAAVRGSLMNFQRSWACNCAPNLWSSAAQRCAPSLADEGSSRLAQSAKMSPPRKPQIKVGPVWVTAGQMYLSRCWSEEASSCLALLSGPGGPLGSGMWERFSLISRRHCSLSSDTLRLLSAELNASHLGLRAHSAMHPPFESVV